MHVIFSRESAEIHYGNSGNFSRDILRILRGYSSADFTGNPKRFSVEIYGKFCRFTVE